METPGLQETGRPLDERGGLRRRERDAISQKQADKRWRFFFERVAANIESTDPRKQARGEQWMGMVSDARAVPMIWAQFVRVTTQHASSPPYACWARSKARPPRRGWRRLRFSARDRKFVCERRTPWFAAIPGTWSSR